MRRPSNIKKISILPVYEQQQFKQMQQHKVQYVHGSTSSSFLGLVKFRALLCMEHIDGTAWFHGPGKLSSGERGYTIDNCYKQQPISKGVSLNNIGNYLDSLINYTTVFSTTQGGSYRVLYGIDNLIALARQYEEGYIEHPVSLGSIGINHIRAVYVDSENVNDARIQLSQIPSLACKVYPLTVSDVAKSYASRC